MLLFYIKKDIKKSKRQAMSNPLPKVIWEQVSPEDAEIRIQRAFEMLLNDDPTPDSHSQLPTILDRDLSKIDNETNGKKIKQITNSSGGSQDITCVSAVDFAVLESEKTQRK